MIGGAEAAAAWQVDKVNPAESVSTAPPGDSGRRAVGANPEAGTLHRKWVGCETVPSIYHAGARCRFTFCPSRLPRNSVAPKGSEVAGGVVKPLARLLPEWFPPKTCFRFCSCWLFACWLGWPFVPHWARPHGPESRTHCSRKSPVTRCFGVYPPNGGGQPGERLEAGLG